MAEHSPEWVRAVPLGWWLAAAVLLFGAPPPLTAAEQETPPAPAQMAEALVDNLAAGDYEAAREHFDAGMRNALPAERLEQVWRQLTTAAGPFQRRGPTWVREQGGFTTVYVPCHFSRACLSAKVVFGAEGKVSGLWFRPGGVPEPPGPPPYADLALFEEREVTVGAGDTALPATLCLPAGDGPFPGLVLVHGSGPHDRDETVIAVKPFRDLAQGLATRGVAVLRYEKRTKAHPERAAAMAARFTVQEEVIDDALAAARLLRGMPRVAPGRVSILGHSLGGMLVPRIAAQAPEAAGFVIMAGSTRPLDELFVEQINYLARADGSVTDEERRQMREAEAMAERIRALEPSDAGKMEVLLGAAPTYWLDLRGYDPAAAARAVERPLLVLHGGRDYQVTEKDLLRWRAALAERENAAIRQYPTLNHLFVEGEGPSTPLEYERPAHVAERVVTDLAAWLKTGQLPAPPE